jgi:hypothetical protein
MQIQIDSLKTQLLDSINYYYSLCNNIQSYATIITHQNKVIKDMQNKVYWMQQMNYARNTR